MIDRDSRDRLAEALEQLANGRAEIEALASLPLDWRDRGVNAIRSFAAQVCKNPTIAANLGPHGWKLRREMLRWLLFLRSEQEYVWPEYDFAYAKPACHGFESNLILVGQIPFKFDGQLAEFAEAGEVAVWPFSDELEYLETADGYPHGS